LVVVRSIGRGVIERLHELRHGRCPRPVAALIVEWTIGKSNAFAVFTVETMLSSSRSRAIDRTPANWDGW